MRFLIGLIKRLSFKSIRKSRIIVFDKNYNQILNNLIDEDFIVFNINKSRLNISMFIKSSFEYVFSRHENVSFYEIYFKFLIKKIIPGVVISFEDTDFRFLRLAKYFKNIKFILVQNSYRPQGFYGNFTLKQQDLLITYTPLVKFNFSSFEIPMKSFKYFGGKDISESLRDKVVFISQYRQYTNGEIVKAEKQYYSEIDDGMFFEDEPNFYSNQDFFLNFISDFFSKNGKNILYKSAYREQTSFQKDDEEKYFKKFNIPEFKVSNEDIFATTSNDIYICLDSTMIFELISNNKKVIIYPHRKLLRDSTCNPHIEIFAKKFPDLVVNENFSDFEKKFDFLDKMSQEEYNSKYRIFNSMQEFKLNLYT